VAPLGEHASFSPRRRRRRKSATDVARISPSRGRDYDRGRVTRRDDRPAHGSPRERLHIAFERASLVETTRSAHTERRPWDRANRGRLRTNAALPPPGEAASRIVSSHVPLAEFSFDSTVRKEPTDIRLRRLTMRGPSLAGSLERGAPGASGQKRTPPARDSRTGLSRSERLTARSLSPGPNGRPVQDCATPLRSDHSIRSASAIREPFPRTFGR